MTSASTVRNQAVARVMDIIEVIVSSSAVIQYKTGITMDYKRRRNQYSGEATDPYPYFVILEANLLVEAALGLEEMVHGEIVRADGRSALARKKWAGAYGVFIPGVGGRVMDPDTKYYFYLAWK
jgi:hypothetical protein